MRQRFNAAPLSIYLVYTSSDYGCQGVTKQPKGVSPFLPPSAGPLSQCSRAASGQTREKQKQMFMFERRA